MHVLRKITDCFSSTNCDHDESSKQEENILLTTNTLSHLCPTEDITVETEIISKSLIEKLQDIRRVIAISEK